MAATLLRGMVPCYLSLWPNSHSTEPGALVFGSWKLEEKKTDVNLALQMCRDVNTGACDRVILVSNDSDAAPALEAIRNDFPQIMIGVVMRVRPQAAGVQTHRRTSGSLAKYADWEIANLDDLASFNTQLPRFVRTNKKPIVKPLHW